MDQQAHSLIPPPVKSLHLDAVDDIKHMVSLYDALKFLNSFCREHDVSNFMMSRVPGGSGGITEAILATNCDPAFVQHLDECHDVGSFNVLERLKQSTTAVRWSVLDPVWNTSNKSDREMIRCFLRFEVRQGLSIPWHTAAGLTGILTFFGRQIEINSELMLSLQIISTHLFEHFRKSQFTVTQKKFSLTPRERDCLMWTSRGKTSADIGQIMKISEHTVNHYLTCAIRKMDAVSRTQAAVKALRAGEID